MVDKIDSLSMREEDGLKRWQRTARGRLKFELAGLSFAVKNGFLPEDYAGYLWSTGAVNWIGKYNPSTREYILKEAEAFPTLYPQVEFKIIKITENDAELLFSAGACLGGWGRDQWSVAHGLGLGKGRVCRYCRQAFRSWSSQLGLYACPEPQINGTCILRVCAD